MLVNCYPERKLSGLLRSFTWYCRRIASKDLFSMLNSGLNVIFCKTYKWDASMYSRAVCLAERNFCLMNLISIEHLYPLSSSFFLWLEDLFPLPRSWTFRSIVAIYPDGSYFSVLLFLWVLRTCAQNNSPFQLTKNQISWTSLASFWYTFLPSF